MANRTFNQFQGTLLKGVVTLYAKLDAVSGVLEVVTQETINAGTSPVTINPSNGFPHQFVSAAGSPSSYTIALQDPYVRLLSVSAVMVDPQGAAGVPISVVVSSDNVNSQTAPSVTLTFVTADFGAGTIAAGVPVDGVILLKLELSNSTAL
jgi:hypothetical protein